MGSLENTRSSRLFFQKEKNYLLDVCWTGEETSKARPPLMRPNIEFKRRHRPELSKTDWLIEQQIARYFSWLSTVTKIGLLTRSPSVNMNEDEEADADDLASEFETDRTRKKIRRNLAKFRRRLQERVQLLLSLKKTRAFASHFSFIFIGLALENNYNYVLGFFH